MRFLHTACIAVVLAGSMPSMTAQTVEMLFTQSTLPKALALKGNLKSAQISAFSAAGLLNITPERKQAYVTKISSLNAALIVGDDAAKAAAAIEFPISVILVDSANKVPGKRSVIHILGPDYAGAVAGAKTVASAEAVNALAATLKAGGDITLKCENVAVGVVVERVLAALAQ